MRIYLANQDVAYRRKFFGCKISGKCCVHFGIIVCVSYFCVSSVHQAIIEHVYHHYVSRLFAVLRNFKPVCQFSFGMAFLCQEQQPSYIYPCRLGSLSPSPQQKMMKPITSVCSWYLCMASWLFVLQQS